MDIPGITSPSRNLEERITVLVVDDMEDSRRLIAHHLKGISCSLLYAGNGIEAISSLKENRSISLILMDMEMPVMDGYTAARLLRSQMKENAATIIAMTSHEGSREEEKCRKAGCSDFLHKPVSREALLQVLAPYLTAGVCGRRCIPGTKEDLCHTVYIDRDLAELVPRFLENRRKDTAKVKMLLAEGDLEAVRIIGHSMAGSAGGYGFPRIGEIGKEMENAALESSAAAIEELNNRLAAYLAKVTVLEKKD